MQSKVQLERLPLAKQRIDEVLAAKELFIRSTATTEQQLLACTRVQVILERSGFLTHLAIILDKTIELEKKAKTNGSYKLAAVAGRNLYTSLDHAKSRLLTQPGNLEEKLATFKKNTQKDIKEALVVLESHRGWKQVLADVASAVLTVLSGFTTYLATNRFRLFKVQTDSEKKLLDLEQNIQRIPMSAGG